MVFIIGIVLIWDMLSTGETVNRNNTGIYIPQKDIEYGL